MGARPRQPDPVEYLDPAADPGPWTIGRCRTRGLRCENREHRKPRGPRPGSDWGRSWDCSVWRSQFWCRPSCAGPQRCSARALSTRATRFGSVAVGMRCGPLERSSRPAWPSWSKRRTERCAHWREIPIALATWATGIPERTRSTSSSLPLGVSRALRCDAKASLDRWLPTPMILGAFTTSARQQPHGRVHLVNGSGRACGHGTGGRLGNSRRPRGCGARACGEGDTGDSNDRRGANDRETPRPRTQTHDSPRTGFDSESHSIRGFTTTPRPPSSRF